MTTEAAISARVADVVHSPIERLAAIGGGSFDRPYRATAADGREYFVKVANGGAELMMAREAEGLRWLAEAVPDGGPRVAEVLTVDPEMLVLDWVSANAPSVRAAGDFGRQLAVLHNHGADGFGGPDGFIASEPLPGGREFDDWPTFYAEARLRPFLARAERACAISAADRAAVLEVIDRLPELAGANEATARLHGDLWSGNVMWGSDGVVLIDPSAHGGHRESDLAMLTLFGLPHLEIVLQAYAAASPLAAGWRQRQPLHQLYPLLVHATLFGEHYGRSAGAAARAALNGKRME